MMPDEMKKMPRNQAFWFLCQVLNVVRDTLPEMLVFYAAGQTDLCHSRWDKEVEMWKQHEGYLGQDLASHDPKEHHKTLVFWLDQLMSEHHFHTCWKHVLDGFCLMDQLSDGKEAYVFNILWAMCITTVAWLRDVCKEQRPGKLRVICVCSAGKHRSVFFSRMLHHSFQLVFELMQLRGHHVVEWIWAAGRRVRDELKVARGTAAKHESRQPATVLHRIKAMFFFSRTALQYVASVNFTDELFTSAAKKFFLCHDEYVFGTRRFLEVALVNGAFPVGDWISDLLGTDEAIYSVILLGLQLDAHWLPYMRQLMQKFPEQCSLCDPHWRLRGSVQNIIEGMLLRERSQQRFFLTAEELADAGFSDSAGGVSLLTAASSGEPLDAVADDVSLLTVASSKRTPSESFEASDSSSGASAKSSRKSAPADSSAASVRTVESLRPSSVASDGTADSNRQSAPSESSEASGGASVRTASETLARAPSVLPKRPAWADAADDTVAEVSKEKKTRHVTFAVERESSVAAADVAYTVLVLGCDLEGKVLLHHGPQSLLASEDDGFLLWANSRRQKLRMQEEEDTSAMINATELRFLDSEALQQEMDHLDRAITAANVFPHLDVGQHEGVALRRIQFYVFLHMWSVLTRTYSFFVSSKFLRLAVTPLQEAYNYDIWTTMSCYCYLIWLHRTGDPEIWSSVPMKLLLPETQEWHTWWQGEQLCAHQISETSFSEEYAIMVMDPLTDEDGKQKKEELDALTRRIRNQNIPLGPEIPQEYAWYQHDVYVAAAESLPTPRAVPVFRCSAGVADSNAIPWGNNDGKPQAVTRENVIVETHCCLEVNVPVPFRLTLANVLCTRDWQAAFQAITLPTPFWLSSAQNAACCFSVRADEDIVTTSLATQIHLQALGAEIMATIRPDNVFHPHLRCHVELMLGIFASVHLERQDADQVDLHDFLEGCGIRVMSPVYLNEECDSWIQAAYDQRHGQDTTETFRPMCHTIWGEKTRPLGYRDTADASQVWYYLVHDCCPFENCKQHQVMLGFGTLCNYWHGFNKRHGKMCTLAANRCLKYTQIGNKGRSTKGARGVDQYFRGYLEHIGMVAARGTNAPDSDQRVCLVGLPRWLPEFYGEGHGPKGVSLVPFHSRSSKKHFVQEDRDACLALITHATNLYDAVVRLL